MIIDVVSIFPDYLAPLKLSLPGKAMESGLLDIRVHDLRQWTYDRHRSVDDTPYGGGAGMVMKPEPWGEALDHLLRTQPVPTLLVMTPAGVPFTQAKAAELATKPRLAIACGRYEGIDARVTAWARTRMNVEEISLGDYVLNGGEAAALVVIEAVARLIPGVIGNPESLSEESHTVGAENLLEYPSYTKPPTWRGIDVPAVLLSGDHGAIATWRRERSADLTRERRPELWAMLPGDARPLLPDFLPTDPGPTPDFSFTPLTRAYSVGDLNAWSTNIEHIRATAGFKNQQWPTRPFSQAENDADVERMQRRHEAGVDYAWTIIAATGDVIGRLVVQRRGTGVEALSWVCADQAHLEKKLRRHVANWLAETWPTKVRYALR